MSRERDNIRIIKAVVFASSCMLFMMSLIFVLSLSFSAANTAVLFFKCFCMLNATAAAGASIFFFILDTRKIIDKNAKSRSLEKREIDKVLQRDYELLLYADFKTGNTDVLKISRYISDSLGINENDKLSYEQFLNVYTEYQLQGDARESFLRNLNVNRITGELRSKETYTYIFEAPAGRNTHYFQVNASKIMETDDSYMVLLGFVDVDQKVRERERRVQLLDDTMKQAQMANEAKNQFISNMSHEMKTPLNAILGLASIVAAGEAGAEEMKGYGATIVDNSRHLLSMVENVLTTSSIRDGAMVLKEVPAGIGYLCDMISDNARSLASGKGIIINVKKEVSDTKVLCDCEMLKNAIGQVVDNAIKYSDKGLPVTISYSELPRTCDDKTFLIIEVADKGIGMDQQEIDRMYSPFEREHFSTDSGIGGLGLGLTLTKGIVDMVNGSINVKSEKGEGTTVTVKLPFPVLEEER